MCVCVCVVIQSVGAVFFKKQNIFLCIFIKINFALFSIGLWQKLLYSCQKICFDGAQNPGKLIRCEHTTLYKREKFWAQWSVKKDYPDRLLKHESIN